jgi:Do/DeqQ family serine protease
MPISKTFLLLLFVCQTTLASLPVAIDNKAIPSLAPILEMAIPAVVNISTEGETSGQSALESHPFFQQFLKSPRKKSQNLGSGVIIDAKQGFIVTNYHVIAKADVINITLSNGKKYTAILVGKDEQTDIALIQIKATNLTAINFANSDKLRVGDFAVAIGNPFGLGQTVTSGIISALGRKNLGIEGYENFIQTDASINPGNSGGALINLRGELIGVNTAILAPNGGNVGIGFSIPSNMVKPIIIQLARHGKVRRGKLGVHIQDIDSDLANAFGIKQPHGALISHIVSSSPAEKSGLKTGDIVIQINDKPIESAADMHNAIGLLTVDEDLSITILRDGKKRKINAFVSVPEALSVAGETIHPYLQGANLSSVSQMYSGEQPSEGIMVTHVNKGSAAQNIGLRTGDVIISANQQQVKSLGELQRVIQSRRSIQLHINRGSGSLYLSIQ